MASIQKPHVHRDGSFGGGASAADTGKECRGSQVVPYSATPDSDCAPTYTPSSGSYNGKFLSICAMPSYKDKSHEELRFEDYGLNDKGGESSPSRVETSCIPSSRTAEKTGSFSTNDLIKVSQYGSFGGGASATDTGKECRGSRVVPYSTTPDSDCRPTYTSSSAPNQVNGAGSYNGKILSISAMPSYEDKSHEELRFEDYGLKGGKSSSSCVETSGTASNVTAENMGPLSTNDLIKLSQSSSGWTTVEFTGEKINRQLNLSMQFLVDQPDAVTSKEHRISSLQVINKPEKQDISSGPVAPLQPRDSPRAWVNFSVQNRKVNFGPLLISNQHEHDVAARKADDVVAILPKLPDGGYYTKPSLQELAAKESEEAGFCRHVNEFVVGRQGYGSIKFVGETDVRHLDIKSIVQFNHREVIVYPDGSKKPGVGQELNKAAEVTLLNVKCINRKTGKQYVEGHRVESYRELLMNKSVELGFEFVSYDPVEGEWKFRVRHF